MHKKGSIYLLPTTLGEPNFTTVLPQSHLEIVGRIRHFIVEKEKTARRHLRGIDKTFPLDDTEMYPLNKHTQPEDYLSYLKPIESGHDIGIISEAGCPGIADPGAEIVKLAHEKGVKVIPLVGPSSILLALMASGMNGQSFVFHGYLPKESAERARKLREIEKNSKRLNQSQIFIETPYRNTAVFEDVLKHCLPHSKLCIACDLTLSSEEIKTCSIEDWKKKRINLQKRPTVFVLMA